MAALHEVAESVSVVALRLAAEHVGTGEVSIAFAVTLLRIPLHQRPGILRWHIRWHCLARPHRHLGRVRERCLDCSDGHRFRWAVRWASEQRIEVRRSDNVDGLKRCRFLVLKHPSRLVPKVVHHDLAEGLVPTLELRRGIIPADHLGETDQRDGIHEVQSRLPSTVLTLQHLAGLIHALHTFGSRPIVQATLAVATARLTRLARAIRCPRIVR